MKKLFLAGLVGLSMGALLASEDAAKPRADSGGTSSTEMSTGSAEEKAGLIESVRDQLLEFVSQDGLWRRATPDQQRTFLCKNFALFGGYEGVRQMTLFRKPDDQTTAINHIAGSGKWITYIVTQGHTWQQVLEYAIQKSFSDTARRIRGVPSMSDQFFAVAQEMLSDYAALGVDTKVFSDQLS